MGTVTGQLRVANGKRGIASLGERIQPPCGVCKRKTYRMNVNHPTVCIGCDEDDVLCECRPIQKIGTQMLVG
jgi:hypothetical protein